MSIRVLPKLPFWAVKKAYRTITLYHFNKRAEYEDYQLQHFKKNKIPLPPEEERDIEADWVIVVSFKGKIDGYVHHIPTEGESRTGSLRPKKHWDNAAQAWTREPQEHYVLHKYRPHTASGKKWDVYWGEDFTPSKDLHQTMVENNAIYWHIIDTIFTPKRWLVIKRP